jgi:hypothetical protein
MQPKPLILFTWDGWWQDMSCTFKGPSSMFQRWNLQMRSNYGLLQPAAMPTNERIQVLLMIRGARQGGGSHQQSRVINNIDALSKSLAQIPGVVLVVQDLSFLSFEEQVQLVGNSSVVVGVHGAGIPSSMHMAVGTKHCCGVLEIFPEGEFAPIRGYGNMARRMGHYYSRLQLEQKHVGKNGGAEVPPDVLSSSVELLLEQIHNKSTCFLPSVLSDPHFSSVPGVLD